MSVRTVLVAFDGFNNDLAKGEFVTYWFDPGKVNLPLTRAVINLEKLDWFLDSRLLRFLEEDHRI